MRDIVSNFVSAPMPDRAARRDAPRCCSRLGCGLGGCAGGGAAQRFLRDGLDRRRARPSPSNRSTARRRRCSTAWSSVLDSESKLRNLSIVSREGTASYRVRSYLSAQVNHGRTMIAWVWDVYDRDQQRALRLSGEEPAGKAGRDAWTAADDLVLRQDRAGRLERPQRHDQRNRPADARRRRRRASAAPRWRARKRLRPPPANSRSARSATPPINAKSALPSRTLILRRKTRLHGLPAAPSP